MPSSLSESLISRTHVDVILDHVHDCLHEVRVCTQSIPILANSQSHLFSLKRPETRPETVFWKVMGSTPVGELRNIFSEQFDMRTLLHSKSILFPPWNGLTTEYYDFPYSTWSYNIFDKETVLFVIGLKKTREIKT